MRDQVRPHISMRRPSNIQTAAGSTPGAPAVAQLSRSQGPRVIAGAQRLLHRRGYLLVLGTFDCSSEWHNISVALQQRGIEGVVAIDATLPSDLALPVASVDLDSMALLEPLAENAQAWLSELGESAAETVIRQIEKKSIPRRMKIAPKFQRRYFALSTADLGTAVITREGA